MEIGKACAITGHRPARFKWKYDERNNGCKRLKKRLRDQFVMLYGQGVRTFYAGGALGVDMWAAEILLRLKERPEYSDIQLVIALPYEGHASKWDQRSQERMQFICAHADVKIVGTADDKGGFQKRNYFMVDQADYLVAVYDEKTVRSGTGMTVRYARKKKRSIALIHPDNGVVSDDMNTKT